MNPLKVAVIVKDRPVTRERERRNMGMWSYPVEEFVWEFFAPGKGATLNTHSLKDQGFDLIFHEDGGAWATYVGRSIPVVFYSIDSTLSDEFHFKPRYQQARTADLVLVDHDRLERFEKTGRPVRRLLYCVNDRLFYPRAEKTIDVNFQCGGSADRARIRASLGALCEDNGWVYRSGVRPLDEYAEAMGQSKIVVVMPRLAGNRPHRLYDAMASGAAVLAYPFPALEGDHLEAFTNFFDMSRMDLATIAELIDADHLRAWEAVAECGYRTVKNFHTWSARAREFRSMLANELSL